MQSSVVSRLMVVSAALLFSTGGAAIKATTLGGWSTAGFRSLVACLVLVALVPESRRGWSWRILPGGLVYALTLVTFVLANKLTTSANAIYLQSTAPLYLLALGPLVLKEPLRRRDLLFGLVLLAAMGLFFAGTDNPVATAPNPARGNLFAVASGLLYAVTLARLRWQSHRPDAGSSPLATVAAGNLIAFCITLPANWPLAAIGAADAAVLLYLGVFQIGLAYWLLTRGMRRVPAFESSTLLLAEPVGNPVFSWLFHHEVPSPWALAGGALIVGATFFKVWSERRDSL